MTARAHGLAASLAVAILVSFSSFAGDEAGRIDSLPPDIAASIDSLVKAGLATPRAYATLRTLTDRVGARLSGSAGDRAAVAWALATLEAQGFSNVHAEPVKVPHWERVEESGAVVAPFPQKLALTALGGSVPTPPGGLEAEVVEARSLEEVDALKEKAQGKIVLLSRVTDRTKDGMGYGRNVGLRFAGPSRAARVGAVGLLLRSIGTGRTRLPHTGVLGYAEDAPKIPAAALANPDAELLHRILESGQPVRVRFSLTTKTFPDADSANVVGEIPGREKPEEIVLLGAHLDSWDLGTGAVDDGAGCAHVIEAARLVGELPKRPRRTLRVVLFANEENGARGANAYAEAHKAELVRHVAAMESDSGAGRSLAFTWSAGAGAEGVLRAIAARLTPATSEPIRKGGDGGVDIAPLKRAGVPLLGIRQDSTGYFDIHHTADDTLDKVDEKDLVTSVAVTASLAYALAEMPGTLPRVSDLESPK